MQTQSLALLQDLIKIQSITPSDAGAQSILAKALQGLGFKTQHFPKNKVDNLYARLGTKSPVFLFAGHTDVVSAGDSDAWHSPPFSLTEEQGWLSARGLCDMKGAIAAMFDACHQFLEKKFSGSIAFLITSGEEGQDYMDGTPYVMEKLLSRGETFDFCLVGEPSSSKLVGDVIKVGRRGSMTTNLMIHGVQGHVAYPHLATNPIHIAAPLLNDLATLSLDKGNTFFPPSSLQITNIQGGVGLGNVIPKDISIEFNIRYSTEQNFDALKTRITSLIKTHHNDYTLHFTHNGPPFLTDSGKLIAAAKKVIHEQNGFYPELSTSGGTSDGRFIAPLGIPLIELGLINESIHKVNEGCAKKDLTTLSNLYLNILKELFT